MNTDQEIDRGLAACLRAKAECSPVCSCGQDLERCAGAHCPRCGTLLAHAMPQEHVARGPLGWVA